MFKYVCGLPPPSVVIIFPVDLPADWEAVVKLSEDFNGADLRNTCTEAGQFMSHSITTSRFILQFYFVGSF